MTPQTRTADQRSVVTEHALTRVEGITCDLLPRLRMTDDAGMGQFQPNDSISYEGREGVFCEVAPITQFHDGSFHAAIIEIDGERMRVPSHKVKPLIPPPSPGDRRKWTRRSKSPGAKSPGDRRKWTRRSKST